jgi:prepilin signal peptidase PulO-like enzyme (type II secretory pathway)
MASLLYAFVAGLICFAVITLLHMLDFDRDTLIAIIGGLVVGLLIAKEERVLGWCGRSRRASTHHGR